MRAEQLTLAWALDTLEDFLALPVTIDAHASLYHDALQLASQYRLPAIYDTQYVALAQYVGCDLWTDDSRLILAVRHELPFVRLPSEYDSAR